MVVFDFPELSGLRYRSPKQCQGLVPAHGLAFKSSQILVTYSHKLCAVTAVALIVGRIQTQIKSICGRSCVYVSVCVACKLSACTIDARTQCWRLYIDTSSSSPCAVCFLQQGLAFSLWRITYSPVNSMSLGDSYGNSLANISRILHHTTEIFA